MPNLVPTRKRKDAHNPLLLLQDKDKVRLVERSECEIESTKSPQLRGEAPVSRAFNNLRRGGIRIFSIFRNAKGKMDSTPSVHSY